MGRFHSSNDFRENLKGIFDKQTECFSENAANATRVRPAPSPARHLRHRSSHPRGFRLVLERRSDAIRQRRHTSPTTPRPTQPPAAAVGLQWNDAQREKPAKPTRPTPHIRTHGPLYGSRKSPRPSARSSPRASTNAARDQGYASPAFRNRNRQKPRKLLPSIALGAPSTGVVGTPLTCYRGKQATAEWKRAKSYPIAACLQRPKASTRLLLPGNRAPPHRPVRQNHFSSYPDRHPPASCQSPRAARCRCSSGPAT